MRIKARSWRDHLVLLFVMMFVASILLSAAPVHAAEQYQVSFGVNPSGGGSTDPSGIVSYDAGSSIPISATASSGYVFASWSADTSSIQITSASSASTTATINGTGTITANFDVEEAKADTQTAVSCSPGSVDVGATATCTATVTSASPPTGQTVSWGSTGSGTFDLISCTLDGSPTTCSVTYIPSDVSSGAHLIVANYVGDAVHLDSSGNFTLAVTSDQTQTTMTTTTTTSSTTTTSGTASIWTDREDYAPGDIPIISGAGFNPNANITVTVTRPDNEVNTWFVISDGSGDFTTTYALDGITGIYTVSATDGTNTATTTFTDAVRRRMTVSYSVAGGGSGYSAPTFHYLGVSCIIICWCTDWNDYTLTATPTRLDVCGDSTWTVSPNPLTGSNATQQWWSSQTLTGTASSDTTIAFTFNRQFKHTVTSSPVTGAGFVKVDGVAQTTPYTTPWWNSGSSHTIEALSPVSGGSNTQYVWSSWSDSGTRSHSVSPTSVTTFTANYKTQYLLTVRTSGLSGASTTLVYVNGTATTDDFSVSAVNDASTNGWRKYFDASKTQEINIDSPITSGGTQFVFTVWSDDFSGSGRPLSVSLGTAKTATANYNTQPKLTVTKTVNNNYGGTAVVSDFKLYVDTTEVASGVENGFNVGAYTVSESGPGGYAATFGGACDKDGKVSLALGDKKTCTITNDDVQPQLTVIKKIINDNLGTAVLTDFTPLKVGDTEVANDTKTGFNAGDYVVSEVSVKGYTATFSGACDGVSTVTLAVGDDVTCTITNDDVQPQLTVIKKIINNNGGTATLDSFLPLKVDGTEVTNGTAKGFDAKPEPYTVTEKSVTGYAATFSGACDSSGKVTLAVGDVKSCIITNTYTGAGVIAPMRAKARILVDLIVLRLKATYAPDKARLGNAIAYVAISLNPILWKDQSHLRAIGGGVFNAEKGAVSQLVQMINDPKSKVDKNTLRGIVNGLVGADKALAYTAYNDAVQHNGKPDKLAAALRELNTADSLYSAGQFTGAIDHYKNAWALAVQAWSGK